MPRLHPDEMLGEDLEKLAIAGSPVEAEQVEAALDSEGMEYTFEITDYMGGILSGIKSGVMFLVRSAEFDASRDALLRASLGHMLID